MKTFRLVQDDILKEVPEETVTEVGVNVRPLAAFGVFTADGKLVGVRIPSMEASQDLSNPLGEISPKPTHQAITEAERELLSWLSQREPCPVPLGGKPFDPEAPSRIELTDDERESFLRTLDSFREPQSTGNPWHVQ